MGDKDDKTLAEKFATDPRLFKERVKISWNESLNPPKLSLPSDGNTLQGKDKRPTFNFASVRKKPFSFDTSGFIEEPEKPPEYNPKDDFESKDNEEGIFSSEAEYQMISQSRSKIPFVKLIPYTLRADEAPLRAPEQFAEHERVRDVNMLSKSINPDQITYVCIMDIQLQSKLLSGLGKLVSKFTRVECIILRGLGLKKISEFKVLPKLKYSDFSRNQISDLKATCSFFAKSPYIEIINLLENPVSHKTNFREKLISMNATLSLRFLNQKDIDVEERVKAIMAFGSKQQRQDIGLIRWDLRISAVPEIQAMRFNRAWRPELIQTLVITDAFLSIFHVGEFVNLVQLDLSNNKLSNIRGNGLEQLENLQILSLKNNLISKKENLRALCFMSSLRQLNLTGNKELGNYRGLVIALTKGLKGDNRSPGLLQLDGINITIEEKVAAISGMDKKENPDDLRLRLNLIAYYGHKQYITPDFLSRVRHLKLQSKRLNVINVKGYLSLEVLDLSGNNLKTVDGLEALVRLKVLNLFNNSRLSLKETLPKLAKTNALEQVWFGMSQENHKHYFKNSKYRAKVLKLLLFNNPNMRFLDNEMITVTERVDSYSLLGATADQVETYRFHLALNTNATMPWNRRFHYTEVAIGNQYDPSAVTALRRMNGHGLVSQVCTFTPFIVLEELNLSNNRLTSITRMGLETLKNLKILDVSRNSIDTPLKEVAVFLDKLSALQVLALRENPCMKSYSDRLNLIGLMSNMKEVKCVLRVIDTEISLDERVEAWKKNGGITEECELLRYKAIMFQRIPEGSALDQLSVIDMSYGGLQHLELNVFENLEVLILKGNRIDSMDAIQGLQSLKKLRVLDLRKNQLSKLEEVAQATSALSSLVTIGLKGNPFCDNKNWRAKLISLLPQLHEEQTSLRLIDNDEISVLEVVRNWKGLNDSNGDRVRWHVIKLLKVPKGMSFSDVTELNISNCELQLSPDVNFIDFPNLEKLSLANNLIKSKQILTSKLDELKKLRVLDLSGNKIKDIGPIVNLVNNLPNLEFLYLHNNPSWPDYDADLRRKFLGKLTQMDHLGASLRYLDGFEITIAERCKSLLDAGVYNDESMERFRLALVWEKLNPPSDTETLSLSGNDIKSIKDLPSKLIMLPNLKYLDLSNNKIQSAVELEKVLECCFKVQTLDLRDNLLEIELKDLIQMIQQLCPSLTTLLIERSLKGKQAAAPKQYAPFVYSLLPNLESVDGVKHPQNVSQGQRKKKSVLSMDWGARPRSYSIPTNEVPPPYPGQDYIAPPSDYTAPPADYTVEPLYGMAPMYATAFYPNMPSDLVNGLYGSNDNGVNDEAPAYISNQDTPAEINSSLYPDLSMGAFSPESYLPQDYHLTIGRNYDLKSLAMQLAQENGVTEEEEEDDKQ